MKINQQIKNNKSNLIYDNKHTFYKYNNIAKLASVSFKSKYSYLQQFCNDLKEFNKLDPKKENT